MPIFDIPKYNESEHHNCLYSLYRIFIIERAASSRSGGGVWRWDFPLRECGGIRRIRSIRLGARICRSTEERRAWLVVGDDDLCGGFDLGLGCRSGRALCDPLLQAAQVILETDRLSRLPLSSPALRAMKALVVISQQRNHHNQHSGGRSKSCLCRYPALPTTPTCSHILISRAQNAKAAAPSAPWWQAQPTHLHKPFNVSSIPS
ncbi:hypothetical protein GUJ93_ZPchr0010g8094 [Zizania palustris]|uniref:Uncharacterized protein n=1 Tax=Zizania palustris TaxID=103762 RepID=A0A8J5WEZ3_ZIZPA|nr:hypothetical protein GUJ93_ZPchr0010g8094 [Zizania palustris]